MDDVPIDELMNLYSEKAKSIPECRKVLEWFSKHNIKTFGYLEQHLNREDDLEGLSKLYQGELRKALQQAKIKYSKQSKPAPLYSFNHCSPVTQLSGEYGEIADLIDNELFREILTFANLISPVGNNLSLLASYPINTIKAALERESGSFPGQNGIRDLLNGRRMLKPEIMRRLVELLDFWDELVRYKIEVGELSNKNYYLHKNLSDRKILVRRQLGQIVKYLVEINVSGSPNIWGISTEKDMQLLLRLVNANALTGEQSIRLDDFVKTLALALADSDFDLQGNLVEKCIVPIETPEGIIFEEQHPLDRFSGNACARRRSLRAIKYN